MSAALGGVSITTDAVIAVAQGLLDEVMVALESTVGGVPELGYLHPGELAVDYLYADGCESASVRITAVTPETDPRASWTVSGWRVTCEVKVTRCYGDAADPAVNPTAETLTRLTRLQQDDADAVRRAVCALPSRPRHEVGVWVPRGAQGGVFSGLTTVTFSGVDASCC